MNAGGDAWGGFMFTERGIRLMDKLELMNIVERILDNAKAAVLATCDAEGRPHMRWMIPAIVPGRPGAMFALTSPRFIKVAEIAAHPEAEWLIQSRTLDEVVNLRGRINVVDNPSLKAEILETIGHRLSTFWKICEDDMDFVVLETVIEGAVYYLPTRCKREVIPFD